MTISVLCTHETISFIWDGFTHLQNRSSSVQFGDGCWKAPCKRSTSWLPAYLSHPEASPSWKLPSSVPVEETLFGSKETKEEAMRGPALACLAPCRDGNSSSGLVSLPSGDSGSFVSNDKIPPHSFWPQQGQVLLPCTPRISWVAERPLVVSD